MASSSGTGEEPPLVTTEAKMVVATGRDNCQQLKDMLSKDDTSSMVVVMASSNQASTPNPRSPPPVMDPGLLAVACSGSWQKLQSFLNGDPRQSHDPCPPSSNGANGSSAVQQPSRDQEALVRESFLDGVTIDGDTFLHVMATNWIGEKLDEVGLIHRKAVQFLYKQNNNGDTPLHCAARMARSEMVSILVDLARGNDANTVKALLETENNSGWTVLHEAVRVGHNGMVKMLMREDSELASRPKDGTSPMYIAMLMETKTIAKTLHEMSGGLLSYSGPNGQNALHAAALRCQDLTNMLLGWNNALTMQQDENGSTALHFSAAVSRRWLQRDPQATIRSHLLRANPDALYQPDHKGSFPIHVAASVDGTAAIRDFIEHSPSCAGLRDRRGMTFLHVAVDKRKKWTVYRTCRNRSLSGILNMQDNNGNTALHLAAQAGGLIMVSALFGNRNAHMSLTNGKGETPLDIAQNNRNKLGMQYTQNSEVKILSVLKTAGAKNGICRQDYFEENHIIQARQNEISQMEKMKDATQNLCVGSVLIATVTFGATFAMPGGYRADDHTNGGTPTLAGRYAFDTFILANALAFTFSTMATISLMCSGSPMYNTRSRKMHLRVAFCFMSIAIKCLAAAFAFGTYMMLAPVAHKTAVAVCVLSSLVLIYQNLEITIKNLFLVVPVCGRKGIVFSFVWCVMFIGFHGLVEYWPIIVIFYSTLRNYHAGKVEPPVQPPTPSP